MRFPLWARVGEGDHSLPAPLEGSSVFQHLCVSPMLLQAASIDLQAHYTVLNRKKAESNDEQSLNKQILGYCVMYLS